MRTQFESRRSPGPRILSTVFAVLTLGLLACGERVAADSHEIPRTPSPEGAKVYLISPTDGAVVKSPLTVRFGLRGMGVAPAGIPAPNTGHHHLVIDVDNVKLDGALPANENHVHFGGGQTEVELELTPGPHTLQLVLADHNHVPHQPPVISEKISITVE